MTAIATRAARFGPRDIVQTSLLTIITVVYIWLCFYLVPWRMSLDPCLIASAATVIVVGCLWITRWKRFRAVTFERKLLASFLAGMPLVYVVRYLFASSGRVMSYWFGVEILGAATFGVLAILGVKRSPWFLVIGIALHGLAWDSWHYRTSAYISDWYVILCLVVDLAFAAYVGARVPAYRRASRTAMLS